MKARVIALLLVLAFALVPSAALADGDEAGVGLLQAASSTSDAGGAGSIARDGQDHGNLVAHGTCGPDGNAAGFDDALQAASPLDGAALDAQTLFEWYEDGTVFVYPADPEADCAVGLYSLLETSGSPWTFFDEGGNPIAGPKYSYERDELVQWREFKNEFFADNAMKQLVICDGVVAIADNAFMHESLVATLKSVSLPSSMHYIGANSFQGLTGLHDVTLPHTLTCPFGIYAFSGSGIVDAHLPLVTDCGSGNPYNAFGNCGSLKRIVVPEGTVAVGGDPNELPSDPTWGATAFGTNMAALEVVDLPSTLLRVSSGAFDTYPALKRVRFRGAAFPACPTGGNLFTEKFMGHASVYYPAGATGFAYAWSGAVARANEWIDVRLVAVPDFDALPSADDVTLDDADAIRAAQAFVSDEPDEVRGWAAGDVSRLEPAVAALDALELSAAKDAAKAELSGFVDFVDYRPAQQEELAAAIAEGEEAIDVAADAAAVDSALGGAKEAIARVKTDAQISAEERAAAEQAERERAEREAAAAAAREAEARKRATDIGNAQVSVAACTYSGAARKPEVKVVLAGRQLTPGKDYTVAYAGNVAAGAGAKAIVTGAGNYWGKKSVAFEIGKAANDVKTAKKKVAKKLKASKLRKRAVYVALPSAKAEFGKAVWKVVKKDKKKVLSLKSGKVRVKKGAKAGTYTIKVRAQVASTANWGEASSKVVTVKVTVR